MNEIKTATIGKGKAVHALFTSDRTLCKRNFNVEGAALPIECDADEVTCKKCLKEIAAEREQAHAEALVEQSAREQGEAEQAHAEAIEENTQLHGAHLVKWIGDDGKSRYCDVRVLIAGISWRDQHHEGPCYDALTETWREEPKPSAKRRRAERRALRASLRKAAPQMRAVARARRAKRGAGRATAKTLLVAAGVPQDVAKSYAPAFSKGSGADKVKARVRKGDTARTKRAEVMRYTWTQFTARLEQYRPADALGRAAFEFRAARERVLA